MVVTAPWHSRLMVAHPQLDRVIRHIIKGMKLLPPDPTQDSPTGFRFISYEIFQRWRPLLDRGARFKGSTVWR